MKNLTKFLNQFRTVLTKLELSAEATTANVGDCEATICQHLNGTRKASPVALIEALRTIEQLGTANHIFAVTQLCCYPHQGVREQSWKTIEKLLRDAPPDAMPAISEAMRRYRIEVRDGQNSIIPSFPTQVLGLLSFNCNGFLREAAIQELVKRYDGKELPFLILSANDWIASIHILATAGLEKRANKEYAKHLIENLALLQRLWRSGRHSFGRLKSDVEKCVVEALTFDELVKIMNAPDHRLRQYVYNVYSAASNRSDADKIALIKIGLSNGDFQIQRSTAETILKEFSKKELEVWLPVLLKHHLPYIRTEALRWVVENKWDGTEELLQAGLFDRSTRVRTLARFSLKDTDLACTYMENLREQRFELEPTLRGLLEMKAKVPRNTVEPFLNNQSGRVRGAAIALLLQDDPADAQQIVMQALTDQSSFCAREAMKHLGGNTQILSAEELWELLNSNTTYRTKRIALNIISKLGKWQALEYLVRAKAITDSKLQVHLDFYLTAWVRKYNASFIKLSEEQFDRCSQAIEKNRELLGADLCKTLNLCLEENLRP